MGDLPGNDPVDRRRMGDYLRNDPFAGARHALYLRKNAMKDVRMAHYMGLGGHLRANVDELQQSYMEPPPVIPSRCRESCHRSREFVPRIL